MSECHKLARSGSTPTQLSSEGVRALVDHVAQTQARLDLAKFLGYVADGWGSEAREWLESLSQERAVALTEAHAELLKGMAV